MGVIDHNLPLCRCPWRQATGLLCSQRCIIIETGDMVYLLIWKKYSVENMHNSYGHNQSYNSQHSPQAAPGYASQDYAISPEEHHDAYYDRPYSPHPQEDYALNPYPTPHDQYQDDAVPILAPSDPYQDDPHFPAPTPSPAPIRRWKTVKEVQLFNGNLVLDCPVPPKLLEQIPHATPPERDEFTHMRYSAPTCDHNDFYEERFTLRQRLFAKPRQTELFIVVTMYNE